MTSTALIGQIMLSGYLLSFIFLNILAFCIASNYKKTFKHKSMRFGFFIAITLSVLAILLLFITHDSPTPPSILNSTLSQSIIISIAGIFSAWNSIILFTTMKQKQVNK